MNTKTTGRAKLCAESCRRRCATSPRSPRPPASRTERVRCALAPEARSTSASRATASDGHGHREEDGAAAPARHRPGGRGGPEGQDYRRPHVGPEATGGEDEGERDADAEEDDSGPAMGETRREAAQRRARARDDEHRQQRLQLVADAVEAHAEARVRAEQRERGQRRAGDHIDRVGQDGQPRRDREGTVTTEGEQRQRCQGRRAQSDQQRFGRLPRFERCAGEEDERQVDDAEPDDADRWSRQPTTADYGSREQRQHPGEKAESDHRPPARGDDVHAGDERFDRRRIDRPLGADRPSRHLRRDVDAEMLEDGRRDVR